MLYWRLFYLQPRRHPEIANSLSNSRGLTVLTREQLMAFLLSTVFASIPNMSSRLKNLIALWFVLQIVVPFTAPLQTLALSDLFPAAHHHQSTPISQESSATPTLRTDVAGGTLVSSLDASPLRVAMLLVVAPRIASRRLVGSAFQLVPLPRVQQTILRL